MRRVYSSAFRGLLAEVWLDMLVEELCRQSCGHMSTRHHLLRLRKGKREDKKKEKEKERKKKSSHFLLRQLLRPPKGLQSPPSSGIHLSLFFNQQRYDATFFFLSFFLSFFLPFFLSLFLFIDRREHHGIPGYSRFCFTQIPESSSLTEWNAASVALPRRHFALPVLYLWCFTQ